MRKVLAGGCFNSIHPGHVYFLNKAKAMGDYLIVVLANDRNNRKTYAVAAKIRKQNLAGLGIADMIVIGNSCDFVKTVKKINPDVIALGYDQTLIESIKKLGIKTRRIKKFGSYSTSKMKKYRVGKSGG